MTDAASAGDAIATESMIATAQPKSDRSGFICIRTTSDSCEPAALCGSVSGLCSLVLSEEERVQNDRSEDTIDSPNGHIRLQTGTVYE